MDVTPEPRDAATVLLLRDDPLRVLVVRRPSRGVFPSAWVFPGGAVDAADGEPGSEAAVRAAAVRETREETGIGLEGPAALVGFAHWITPVGERRRFDTRFYVVRAPADAEARVDGVELVDAAWVEPRSAPAPMLPPTRLQLARLAESPTVDAVLSAARARAPFVVRPVLYERDGAPWIRIPAEAGYGVEELPVA